MRKSGQENTWLSLDMLGQIGSKLAFLIEKERHPFHKRLGNSLKAAGSMWYTRPRNFPCERVLSFVSTTYKNIVAN